MRLFSAPPLLQAAALALLAQASSAQTVYVTTPEDVVDINLFTATVADLPGPDGEISFKEALAATDNTPGVQTIGFQIPTSKWVLTFLYPGVAVIKSTPGNYRAFDTVIIDATTQTAFTGDTNPAGGEVAIYRSNLYLLGDGSLVKGFTKASELILAGNDCTATGNDGGIHITVQGDNALVQGNETGTIKLDRVNNCVVVGNTTQRVRVWGFNNSSRAVGNRIGGPTLAERNLITGYGTTSQEGLPVGADVELFQTQDTIIENNWIGTKDGLTQGNLASNMGIEFLDGNVGTRVRNNLIGGILGRGQPPHWAGTVWGWAVYFSGNGNDIELTGNTIGLDVNGDPTLGSVWGIHTDNSLYTDVRIGGMGPGEGNVIAGHLLTGITIGRGNRGVRLAGNSIHSNATSGSGFLGIDLIGTDLATGVTPNDPLDEDLGGNGLQNYPVIATAVSEMGGTRIQGALDSAPNQTYTLEFFASPTCDPTGFGQGSTPLGFATVTTDSGGHAAFDVLVGTSSAGDFVSSTATLEPEGSTSEFSACVQTTGSTCATNIGFGGPGSSVLSLCGTPLGTGGSATLNLDSAPANEPVWITFGPTNNPTPLFGGTVVPVPGRTMFLGMTAADGTLSFGPILGGGGPATIYAQAAVRDPSIPTGFGISNAIEIQFLP